MSNNLLFLGNISRFTTRVPPEFSTHVGKRTAITREKIIKKAIYKCCLPQVADKAINWYRRSDDSPQAVTDDFLRTDQQFHPLKRDHHYKRALRVTERLMRPSRTLHPIAYPDLRYYPWTLHTSAEVPYTTEPKWKDVIREKMRDGLIDNPNLSFHNLYDEIFINNRQHVHDIKYHKRTMWNKDGTPRPYQYTTLHTRSHLVGADEPDKLRAVFGVPKLLLQVENMFIWNIQKEYLNNKKGCMLWGFETMKGGWRKLFNRFSHKRISTFLSIDWSQFDRRALHSVIDDIHDMWRSWFNFSRYEPTSYYPEAKPASEHHIERLWSWMCYSIKHTPIVTPTNEKYQWRFNGIASGFQQTQLLDSFVNMIMTLTCLSAVGINIESDNFDFLVQGDDSISGLAEWLLPHEHSKFLSSLRDEARSRFNAKLSDKKSYLGTQLSQVSVLSYAVTESGLAYRDESLLLAHLLYPERPQTLEATAAACIGIAQASMGCSTQVYNACKDAFDFITTKLKRQVKPSSRQRYVHETLLGGTFPTTFPSLISVQCQQFDLSVRTESQCERLWPTKESSAGGFYFLNK